MHTDIKSLAALYESVKASAVIEFTGKETPQQLQKVGSVIVYHISDSRQFKLTTLRDEHLHTGPEDQAIARAEYKWLECGCDTDQYLYKVTINTKTTIDQYIGDVIDDPEDLAHEYANNGCSLLLYQNFEESPPGEEINSMLVLNIKQIVAVSPPTTLSYRKFEKTFGFHD